MPELPEVETVKRELEKNIIGRKCSTPIIINSKCIQTDKNEYIKGINNSKICSLSREGKFLLIHLDNSHKIIFHLRMEGKLFYEEKEKLSQKHLSLYIPLDNNYNLAFYDSRKFGVTYYLKEGERGPLGKLGLEPSQINDVNYLLNKIKGSNKCIKQILLDQEIIAGLGNIYADEVLFASDISPFKKGKEINKEEASSIIKESKRILDAAIKNNGSTIRSYQASSKIHGSFQSFLKVYGKEKEICCKCNKLKIERKRITGRSTYYCSHCQDVGISIAITGNIASGKSTVAKIFKDNGYVYFSADEEVAKLYQNKEVLNEIKKKFKNIFVGEELDKKTLITNLVNDSIFKRKYETYIFAKIKEKVNEFFIQNNGVKKVFEIPLLFNAKMEDLFTIKIGVENSHNSEYLNQRQDNFIKEKIQIDKFNKYKEKKHKLDYVIKNDSTIEDLEKQVKKLIKEIEKNYNTF